LQGDKLESLTNDFRRELNENPPLSGAFTPRKGEGRGCEVEVVWV
jgi:hypothetical protein